MVLEARRRRMAEVWARRYGEQNEKIWRRVLG